MSSNVDPLELIEGLSVGEILQQIAEADRRRKALSVLLRAARARERDECRQNEGERAAHAK